MAKRIAYKRPVGRVSIETNVETRLKIRVAASMQGITMQEWLDHVVSKAYEAARK